MLTEYKGDVFEVAVQDDKWMLRKYVPTQGFERGVITLGNKTVVCYERETNIKELTGFFDVRFCGKLKDCDYEYDLYTLNGDTVSFMCSDRTGALQNGYIEIEDKMWIGYKHLDDFETLVLKKFKRGSRDIETTPLTKNTFIGYWKKFVTDVRPSGSNEMK